MFLKELKINSDIGELRNIKFHKGMNLIVDESFQIEMHQPSDIEIKSGNSVGKTTVLKLINFCLGGDKKDVYTDPENNKNIDYIVEEFLESHKVNIYLTLKENLDIETSDEIRIERNFLSRKEKIARINGNNFTNEKEFSIKLREIIYPDLDEERPTFSQLIANNIRYKDIRINNTINNLDANTKQFEYESLYLYMLGCPANIGKQKLELQEKIKQESAFLKKLTQQRSKNAYSYALTSIINDIEVIDDKKSKLNINELYKQDLDNLDKTKLSISLISQEITTYNLRLDYIRKSIQLIDRDKIDINIEELRYLYDDVTSNLTKIHHTFEELVLYHDAMLNERKSLLIEEQSEITALIANSNNELIFLLEQESKYAEKVKKCDTLEDLDRINKESNALYQKKGEYENAISQINESESRLSSYDNDIASIEKSIFSEEFVNNVQAHVAQFDTYFTKYSKILYGESFHFKHEIKKSREGQQYYKFDPYSMSTSSGKKQGEALSFDLAYIDYAQHEKISHLDFLLNDKKELMDIHQIISIANILNTCNAQLVFSILQDKLPQSLNNDRYVILRLSQDDKLFRIEEISAIDHR